jgi:5-methylcytosine-specific restriction endonuclease McrA
MTAREVPEWVGKTPDTPAPARVRLRVFEAHGGRCYLTGRKIMPGDAWELDHKVALINGGLNIESNLAPALKAAHREKTNADVAEKAKVARVRMKHLGIFPKSKRPLRSRGFSPSRDVMGDRS